MSFLSAAGKASAYRLGHAILTTGVDTSGLQKGLKDSESQIGRSALAITGIAGRMSMAVAAPMMGIAGAAIGVAAAYEATMRHVQAVSSANAAQMLALEAQTRRLAETTRFTMREVGEAQVFLAMAGMEVNTIIGSMDDVLNLATASGLGLARTADLMTNIMTAFKLEASESTETVDVLSTTFTNANVNMEQLAQSMKYAAPIAASLGHTVSETAAAIGVLGGQGIQGSQSGVYMRQIFAEFLRPSARLGKKLDELGFSTRNFRGELMSTAEIVYEFERLGLNPDMGFQMLQRRSGTGLTALASAGAEAQYALQTKHDMGRGKTEEIAKGMMDHLIGDIARIRSKFETALEGVAKIGLYQWARNAAEGVAGLLDKFNRLGESTKRWWGTFGIIAIGLPPLIYMLARLTARIVLLGAAMKGLNAIRKMGGVGEYTRSLVGKGQVAAAAVKGKVQETLGRSFEGRFVPWGSHSKWNMDIHNERLAMRAASEAAKADIARQARLLTPEGRLAGAHTAFGAERKRLWAINTALAAARKEEVSLANDRLVHSDRLNELSRNSKLTYDKQMKFAKEAADHQRAINATSARIVKFKAQEKEMVSKEYRDPKTGRFMTTKGWEKDRELLQKTIKAEEDELARRRVLHERSANMAKSAAQQRSVFTKQIHDQTMKVAEYEKKELEAMKARADLEKKLSNQQEELRRATANRFRAMGAAGRAFPTPRDPRTGRFMGGMDDERRAWQEGRREFDRDVRRRNAHVRQEAEAARANAANARRLQAAQRLAEGQTLKNAAAQGRLASAYGTIKGLKMPTVFRGITSGMNMAVRAGSSLLAVMGGLPGLFLTIGGIIVTKLAFDKVADEMEKASWASNTYAENIESINKKYVEMIRLRKIIAQDNSGGGYYIGMRPEEMPKASAWDVTRAGELEDAIKAQEEVNEQVGIDQATDNWRSLLRYFETVNDTYVAITSGEVEAAKLIGVISEGKGFKEQIAEEKFKDFEREFPEMFARNVEFLDSTVAALENDWKIAKGFFDDVRAIGATHQSVMRARRADDLTQEQTLERTRELSEDVRRIWDMAKNVGYAGEDAGRLDMEEFFRGMIISMWEALEVTDIATEGLDQNTDAIDRNREAFKKLAEAYVDNKDNFKLKDIVDDLVTSYIPGLTPAEVRKPKDVVTSLFGRAAGFGITGLPIKPTGEYAGLFGGATTFAKDPAVVEAEKTALQDKEQKVVSDAKQLARSFATEFARAVQHAKGMRDFGAILGTAFYAQGVKEVSKRAGEKVAEFFVGKFKDTFIGSGAVNSVLSGTLGSLAGGLATSILGRIGGWVSRIFGGGGDDAYKAAVRANQEAERAKELEELQQRMDALRNQFASLGVAAMEGGAAVDKFYKFVKDHVDIERYRDELDKLARSYEKLWALRKDLDFAKGLSSAISGAFGKETDVAKLIRTGEVTDDLARRFSNLGGNSLALHGFGQMVERLREFEKLADDFDIEKLEELESLGDFGTGREGNPFAALHEIGLNLIGLDKDLIGRFSGKSLEGLVRFKEIVKELSGKDIGPIVSGIKRLEEKFNTAQNIIGELTNKIHSPISEFFKTGDLTDAVIAKFDEIGLEKKYHGLVENVATSINKLAEFDEAVTDFGRRNDPAAFDSFLDSFGEFTVSIRLASEQLKIYNKNLETQNEFNSALSRYLPVTDVQKYFQKGEITSSLASELGIDKGLLEGFTTARENLQLFGALGSHPYGPQALITSIENEDEGWRRELQYGLQQYGLPEHLGKRWSAREKEEIIKRLQQFMALDKTEEELQTELEKAAQALHDAVEKQTESTQDLIRKQSEKINDLVKDTRDTFLQGVSSASLDLRDRVEGIVFGLGYRILDFQKALEDAIEDARKKLTDGASALGDKLTGALEDNIIPRLESAIGSVTDSINDLIEQLKKGVNLNSPNQPGTEPPTPSGGGGGGGSVPPLTLGQQGYQACAAKNAARAEGAEWAWDGKNMVCVKITPPQPTPPPPPPPEWTDEELAAWNSIPINPEPPVPPTPPKPEPPPVPNPPGGGHPDGGPYVGDRSGGSGGSSGGGGSVVLQFAVAPGRDPDEQIRNMKDAIEDNRYGIRDVIWGRR